jgi:hypothetical protein
MENRGSEMTIATSKESIKKLLGEIPYTAELYWLIRQRGKPIKSRFSLKNLEAALPELAAQAAELRQGTVPGRKVFIFATLHYWIEHAALLGMALASQGHQVTFAYIPYHSWQNPINRFDLRRQNAYAKEMLCKAEPLMQIVPFLNIHTTQKTLPDALMAAVDQVTTYDTQYTLQVEEVDPKSEIYQMRKERNQDAAVAAHAWLRANRPDVVIIPNGTLQEMGVVYRVARFLKIPTVTYEFGDQRQRIWLAQNGEVMRQETDTLWEKRRDKPLTPEQYQRVESLFTSRQRATLWENFARRWQGTPSQGGEKVRAELGLDDRPIVLLATNVLGDSLTLGRHIFSRTMAEWIERTVQYFSGRQDVQLVIRVHPGEVLTHGLSMVDVVHQVLPRLPEHIHLIGPKDTINTYDVVEVADLGLVYTTTVGLEMTMSGLPVIVSGETHYRDRGFTHDVDSWVTYFKLLGQILENPGQYRLDRTQVDLAWNYAYRFFFDYPRPYPWHLVRAWEDYKIRKLKDVFSPEGEALYGETFRYFVGKPLDWSNINEGNEE